MDNSKVGQQNVKIFKKGIRTYKQTGESPWIAKGDISNSQACDSY